MYIGAESGAAIGSLFFPGIGTVAGAVVGGVAGGISGSIAAEKVVEAVGDEAEWGIEWYYCKRCGRRFKCLKYKKESTEYCPDCRK